jgi:hypothetical protein
MRYKKNIRKTNKVCKERIESMVESIYAYFCNGSQGNVLFES